MPKEETLYSDAKVKYNGIFDLSLLYKRLRGWYMNSGYGEPKEIKYAEKVKPDGKQLEIVWEASKKEEADYFELWQGVKFYVTRLNEVEVDKDGQKLKLDKCNIELTFSSKIIMNANKKWDESSLMFRLYERFIIKYRVEELKIDAFRDTTKMMDEVKNFLNLYRF